MVADFNVPVTSSACRRCAKPTAWPLSSRNARLVSGGTAVGDRPATARCRLLTGRSAGGDTDAESVKRMRPPRRFLTTRLLKLEYLEIVDPDDMQPVERIAGPVRVAGALWVGSTRLIDNVLSTPPAVLQS